MSDMNPFIAALLQCPPESLTENAALGETPGWDSFAQLNIMMELERRYAIPITDETIRTYSRLSAIKTLTHETAKP